MGLPISFFSLRTNDNTKKPNGDAESATLEVPITTMTPANAAAVMTAVGNLRTQIAAISIGQPAQSNIVYQRNLISKARASSVQAQREKKWLCKYTDNVVQKEYRVEIPCADLTLLADGEEFLDLATAPGSDFKSAFEAVVVSPYDPANAVTLRSVQYVGRKG